jgi:hypothetical protein
VRNTHYGSEGRRGWLAHGSAATAHAGDLAIIDDLVEVHMLA